MSTETLNSIGVKSLDDIDYYTVRREGDKDILKIYHQREKGALFHRSQKFKFHRASKIVPSNRKGHEQKEMSEVSPMLLKAMEELDAISRAKKDERNNKEQILSELKHLEKVVSQKIREIEERLEKL